MRESTRNTQDRACSREGDITVASWLGQRSVRARGEIRWRASAMDKGQTSGDGVQPQTDYQTPPESQTELPATLRPPSSCWTKREHDGRAEAPCKSQRTSCNAIGATVVLDDTQRKVLEELVTRVDAAASVVITNPRAKGAASPSPAVAWPIDHLAPPPSLPAARSALRLPAARSALLDALPYFPGCGNTAPPRGDSPHPPVLCCGRQPDCLRDGAVADHVRLHV
jgi:hypothetical protein